LYLRLGLRWSFAVHWHLGTSRRKERECVRPKGPAHPGHKRSWENMSCGDVRRPQRRSYIGLPIVKGGLTRAGYLSLSIYPRPPANSRIPVLFTGFRSWNCDILATVSEDNLVNET
jgi:hypothetical protein